MEDKVELTITAITHAISSKDNFVVVLHNVENTKRLPIVIGHFEAQQLAVAIEKMGTGVPLIHEIFKNFIIDSGHKMKEMLISDLKDGVFFGTIYFEEKEQNQIVLPSRVSDALTLATIFNAPIFIKGKILEEVDLPIEEETIHSKKEMSFFEKIKKIWFS